MNSYILTNNSFCGQPPVCFCTLGFLLCAGEQVTILPNFTKEYSMQIVHIDIFNTSLNFVPKLNRETWPLMHTIDIRSNKYLKCKEILKWTVFRPDLNIYHEGKWLQDQDTQDITLSEKNKNHTELTEREFPWLMGINIAELIAIVLFFFIFFIYSFLQNILQYRKHMKLTNNDNCENEMCTLIDRSINKSIHLEDILHTK